MRQQRILLLGIYIALSSACTFGGHGRPLEELMPQPGVEEIYRVNAGDTLDVRVWGESRLSGKYDVRNDGKFTMPLINDVAAEGRTLEQIKNDITTMLQRYVPAASVTVAVGQTAPIRYYLSGAFVKPGEFRSDGRITFLQAIATGGGFAPFADESSLVLIRKTAEGELRYKFDYNRAIDGREPNPELKTGDIIAVQ